MRAGIFKSSIGYFIGGLTKIATTPNKIFTKKVGYIMSADATQCSGCLTLNMAYSSTANSQSVITY